MSALMASAGISSSPAAFPFLSVMDGVRKDPFLVLGRPLAQNFFTRTVPEFLAVLPLCLDVCLPAFCQFL